MEEDLYSNVVIKADGTSFQTEIWW